MGPGPVTYFTLRACCNPLVKYIYSWTTTPFPSIGDVYVDDSGVCWIIEAAGIQGCTNTNHVITTLTPYTGGGCSECLEDNPVSCPALDIANSYNICVWWWNLGVNVGFRLQSSGTPLNELYWTGAEVEAYTTANCSGSISATGSWTGSTLLNLGGGSFNVGPTLANTFSGWDAGDISATVFNLSFSSETPSQSFTTLSNNEQFVICAPGGNELVTVYASECLGSNISPCSLPTPTPTTTQTVTPSNTPTQTPTPSGLPDFCKCYQVAADVGPGFNSVSYLDCNHVPQQIDNIAISVFICAIDGSISVTNLSYGEVDESFCGGCTEGPTPTPTPNETPTPTNTPSISPTSTPFTNGAILNTSTSGSDIDLWGSSISILYPTITYPISGGDYYNFQHSGWVIGDSIVVSVTGGTYWALNVYKNATLLFTSGYTSPYAETYNLTDSGTTSDFLTIEVADYTPPTPTPTTTTTLTATPTQTPSDTPTQTPTSTPTPTNPCGTCSTLKLIYDASLCSTACIFGSGDAYYYCGPAQTLPLSAGTILYSGNTCTGVVPDGYYSDVAEGGSSCYTVSGGGGQITAVNPCSTPTATVTATPTQTPTPTETPTNTPTNTPTETPTNTPTPSTTPAGNYQFVDCCDPTNIFRYYNVGPPLTIGSVYDISLSTGFTGCATVVVNTGAGPLYDASGLVTFTGPFVDCNACGVCPSPTPTNTPSTTPTPTNTPSDTPTPTPTNTPSETPTSTPTNTPSDTPTQTPTTTNTPTNTETPTQTPTDNVTDTPTPTPTQTPTQTPVVPTVICKSATTASLGWYYHDCCGNYVSGNDLGLDVCIDTNRPNYGMTISASDCLAPVCYSAATLADCCTGEIFFALVDQSTASGGPVEAGVVYRFNGRSYYFIQFGGPGGPYLGLPDYGSCESANIAFPCVTPTATEQILPTPTPTLTPSPTPAVCSYSAFCFTTQYSAYTGYNGTYYSAGTYNGDHLYYTGDTGFIYYFTSVTESYWCLSSTLGGACDLRGAVPCWSSCPDISGEIFSGGVCPTPTPSPYDCTTLDFLAYYDCDYEPLPTPTPSVPCDLVNFDFSGLGVTPTPTPSGGPCSWTLDFSLSGYTPPVTPTVTSSPTVTITRTVDVAGQVSFTVIDEVFSCTTVKVLVDCVSGVEYLVNQPLNYEGSNGLIPISTGFTMLVMIESTPTCVTYTEDRVGSSNTNVEQIISLLTNCSYCNTVPTPTPTVTPSSTLTSTPTPSITSSTTPTPTQTPTRTPTATLTPSPTSTVGTTPPPTPSITSSPTITQTSTPTQTASNTPTSTMTPTPSTTPTYVYVYESCSPIGIKVQNYVQVIQTEPVGFPMVPTNVFKDEAGNCWKYLGQFNTNYIPPVNINSFTFGGNYFDTANTYVYNSCQECEAIPAADPCANLLYFSMTTCADNSSFVATSCDLQDSFGNSLVPPVGTSVVCVEFDENGTPIDQFCAILGSQTVETATNFVISLPPSGFTYNCDTCPLYYKYTISTCNADSSQVVNFPMYSLLSFGLLPIGTVVSVNENANCWTIVTQEGEVEEPYLMTIVGLNEAYTYQETFVDCTTCLEGQTTIILSQPQTGTNPYNPTVGGGGVQRDLFLNSNYNQGEIVVIQRVNNE